MKQHSALHEPSIFAHLKEFRSDAPEKVMQKFERICGERHQFKREQAKVRPISLKHSLG